VQKLNSVNDLKKLRRLLFDSIDQNKPRIVICAGTACQASNSINTVRFAKKYIFENHLSNRISLRITGCHGFCEMGPFILTEPQQAFYVQVKAEDIPRIIDALLQDKYVEDLLYRDIHTGEKYYKRDDIPFFKNQRRNIMSLNQKIDPTRIYDYIMQKGYAALESVLSKQNAGWVVEEVKKSGLRGRGGGGFPTGLKWELLAKQSRNSGKYLVCNADEGDPGAYMDRSILESNPHSIIEGMIIGAYGTGATEGIVYVRNEYPIAIMNLSIALEQAYQLGILGDNILGSGFSFHIKIVKGAGAFVCGEETSLIKSVEGKRGEPRQRPPYPTQKGVNNKPTVINNVETWANIPLMFRIGAKEFAKVGNKNNSGTKIFSLVGKIKNTGLVEVPMGITIKEIVYNIGGGAIGKAKIKAVQTGGPSGGCIPADMFDLPIDYDSLTKAGSIMGSGGMIVMDENTCMVDVAKYFMNFLKDESCGKCFTCRKGIQRMYEILDDISTGAGTIQHLDLLKELAQVVQDTAMCGLGQTASNPVLSTLQYFYQEYLEHVVEKRCKSFVCRKLVGPACQAACPLGTEAWHYIALIEKGKYKEAYKIIRASNPLPSICARVCDYKCETRCNLGVTGGEAVAIRSLKRFITDRIDPSVYKPVFTEKQGKNKVNVAVIGSGPAGISAAHYLSLNGYQVTIFEAADELGGMLISCIPAYRLPRDILRREIKSLINKNITIKLKTSLGRDITINGLLNDRFKAIFMALGADKSWRLDLEGEDTEGVYTSMHFLKEFNLRNIELARGNVGIIGGGNSAVDAARVAIRQKNVKSVTLFYRRTSQEMPAYAEEVEAALEEGIKLETLVSPIKIRYIDVAIDEGIKVQNLVSPVKIDSKNGHLANMTFIRNRLGEIDSSGRRKPVPIPDSEYTVPLDTLIVAIGERPDSNCLTSMGLDIDDNGRLKVDPKTFRTNKENVFAGGDLVTGPNTVVDAIAAGKKAANIIDRYLKGDELIGHPEVKMSEVVIKPPDIINDQIEDMPRVKPAVLSAESRKKNFLEVERTLSVKEAKYESRRCLRCDLEFNQSIENKK
jgi:NADH-quinone oxidoreductase subunit F